VQTVNTKNCVIIINQAEIDNLMEIVARIINAFGDIFSLESVGVKKS
jgi:hypothetical protein